MRTLIKGFVVSVLMSLAPVAAASSVQAMSHQASAEGCASNCAVVIKHGGKYLAVAKNEFGELFRIQTLDVPANARFENSSSQDIAMAGSTTSDGGRVETEQKTYTAPNGVYVVTTVISYDADGNIVDVQSKTMFFPKTTQER